MNYLKLALALIASLLILSCNRSNLKETTIDLPSNKLVSYSLTKNTKYLIVFESGLGMDHNSWTRTDLITKISSFTDVLLYDRAGIGKSAKGPDPRNIERLSAELGGVIDKFSNGRKVILVGHSLGGIIIRDYAIKNPQKTAAILFVDPFHDLYINFSQSIEDTICNSISRFFGPNFGGVSEARELVEDIQYSSTLPSLPNVPIIVITSMKQSADNVAADKIYGSSRQLHYNAHEQLKIGVTDFTHVATTNSGHDIMYEEPNLIIDNIKLLISKLP